MSGATPNNLTSLKTPFVRQSRGARGFSDPIRNRNRNAIIRRTNLWDGVLGRLSAQPGDISCWRVPSLALLTINLVPNRALRHHSIYYCRSWPIRRPRRDLVNSWFKSLTLGHVHISRDLAPGDVSIIFERQLRVEQIKSAWTWIKSRTLNCVLVSGDKIIYCRPLCFDVKWAWRKTNSE